jgi:hypothetical protein
LISLGIFSACAQLGMAPPKPSPADEAEFSDLKSFYEKLKEGQSRGEVEKLLNKKRELICEGNNPGPQRCVVKFRVLAGEDFGASRLGVQYGNATVKDEYRILSLDFRKGKLIRWDSKSEILRR